MIKLSGQGSLYRQLYESLKNTILAGEYKAGEKLPSSRELAKSLHVSRNTVINCYEQLLAEGYIETRFGSGSFVADNDLSKQQQLPKQHYRPPKLSDSAQYSLKQWQAYDLNHLDRAALDVNFQYGPVDINEYLLKDINQIARRFSQTLDSNYQRPEGLLKLRESIARYAQQNRGCQCNADNIVITNGSQQALDLIARLLIQKGEKVIIEEPGYRGAAQAFSNAGAELIRCDVDIEGIDLDKIDPDNKSNSTRNNNVRLVYTTPSHQFPTGAVLPLSRRIKLLEWANANNAFIVEDDYDSEFRYQGPPIEAIQGLDQSGQTIYIGTFSKVLSPVLRIGYVILPTPLVEPFTALKWCSDRHSPLLNQQILAEFINSPLYARHLKRMRKIYSRRREILISKLEEYFGDEISVEGTNAGIHLLVWFKQLDAAKEADFIQLAKNKSVGVYSANKLYQKPPENLGLLIGYGNSSCDQIERGIERLAECYSSLTQQ
ncbi:PLP-dependent aminotransferase family protein [Cocleimonas sp. KMM 6892]|uniref:MocR-like pyridoxine biosynthesis transcription factor PdxR n=1 Tax=unclassified Cocleimonas TaxID=2639732 RepID=UPI002DB71B1F|nr:MULTISPECIES: PLP-dependent aminotransferase family protein [unclassified Cocleimonas]MEB8431264.1 PLP-dependent aminotransferase family protein [Cocleimonas sp. KMM 6892]MEC4713964.1 PLP-dependent aminotransferase family protein [Cocleimonas sp. KMM 6895]MEC4743295.1 PLP-dependent aminotransferase family protein [Cocleimonas sp. KMM 6896]